MSCNNSTYVTFWIKTVGHLLIKSKFQNISKKKVNLLNIKKREKCIRCIACINYLSQIKYLMQMFPQQKSITFLYIIII